MEKVILANGHEFELVANGVSAGGDSITFTFIPGASTAEQLMEMWVGNQTITVKNDEVSINVYTDYLKCDSVTLVPDYVVDMKPVCPECDADVAPDVTACPSCKAEFTAPAMKEVRAKVCTVTVSVPNINDRMSAAENTIDTLVAGALAL